MAGYPETLLPKKLGLKAPLVLFAIDAPHEYLTWLGELPAGVQIASKARKPIQATHLFVTTRAILKKNLVLFRKQLEQDGFVWVSWPKKAAKVEADITEDTIREIALPLGFVDIKVCAVSDVWSGLKLVIRKNERTAYAMRCQINFNLRFVLCAFMRVTVRWPLARRVVGIFC